MAEHKEEKIDVKISGMIGKGSIRHNNREFIAKNVNANRTDQNVILVQEDIKDVYHELFDEALAEYNNKKKKTRDKIDDYYNHILNSKQEKTFYEVIFQIGDINSCPAGTEAGEQAKWALYNFYKDFQRRNPYLRVFNAVIHMDEATPHLHIDFVPYITGSKRGLSTRVSLKQALKQQGFDDTKRGSQWSEWMTSEKAVLERFAENEQFHVVHGEGGIRHLSIADYKEQMDMYDTAHEKWRAERKQALKDHVLIADFLRDHPEPQMSDFSIPKNIQLKKEIEALEDKKADLDHRIADNYAEIEKQEVKLDDWAQREQSLKKRKTALDEREENLDARETKIEADEARIKADNEKLYQDKLDYNRKISDFKPLLKMDDPQQYIQEHEQLKAENRNLKSTIVDMKNWIKRTIDRFMSLVSVRPNNSPNYLGFTDAHFKALKMVAVQTYENIARGTGDSDYSQYAENLENQNRYDIRDELDSTLGGNIQDELEDEQGYEAD